MPESLATRLARWRINLFPAYRGTGGRVTYIADDWREVRVRVPLGRRTRNLVGTIFGGSMYGAVDPFYMIMLMRLLGPDFVVWDKAASIRFRRPGRSTLSARLEIEEGELERIRRAALEGPSVDHVFSVELTDRGGETCARVEKTLYIARRERRARRRETPGRTAEGTAWGTP